MKSITTPHDTTTAAAGGGKNYDRLRQRGQYHRGQGGGSGSGSGSDSSFASLIPTGGDDTVTVTTGSPSSSPAASRRRSSSDNAADSSSSGSSSGDESTSSLHHLHIPPPASVTVWPPPSSSSSSFDSKHCITGAAGAHEKLMGGGGPVRTPEYHLKVGGGGDMEMNELFERLPDRGLILRMCLTMMEWANHASQTFRGSKKQQHSDMGCKDKFISKRPEMLSSPLSKILLAVATLVVIPLLVYLNIPASTPSALFWHLVICWDSLLHTSIWPIVSITFAVAVFTSSLSPNESSSTSRPSSKRWFNKEGMIVAALVLSFSVSTTVTSQLQVVAPSWIWNPFLWGTYQVYDPQDISQALGGLCVDGQGTGRMDQQQPLCLPESSWNALSSGTLSSRSPDDVSTVMKGLKYAKTESGGIIINVMSRDTVDAIGPLRANVEGIVPFFSKLTVVVFENDSADGSREAFKRWADEARGYDIDLINCGEDNPDCKFGESHRYDAKEAKDYFKSSAIGRMAEFRQKIVDHVMGSEKYDGYSHMAVIDLDLGVSLSPLGLLHTLGKLPNDTVASAGRQVWPGSFGTLVPPYDFSAFRALETPGNKHLLNLHSAFCGILPPGDRWRNQCDAVSPMHLMLVLAHDWSGDQPYRVESAFNGATLYPLKRIRDTGSKYDVGEDGQRCEHIGFNVGLNDSMFINPKWGMHVSPVSPGGPTGTRAMKNVVRIVFTPRISFLIFFQNVGCMVVFVMALMVLGRHAVRPAFLAAARIVCLSSLSGKRRTTMAGSSGVSSSASSSTKKDTLLPLVVDSVAAQPSYSSSSGYRIPGLGVWGFPKRKMSDFESSAKLFVDTQ